MRLPLTLNIQCGKKLSSKSKEDILKEVLIVFQHNHVKCVQVAYEVIRVTLASAEEYKVAKQQPSIRLLGMWCPILGGGPPITILHIFDYPITIIGYLCRIWYKGQPLICNLGSVQGHKSAGCQTKTSAEGVGRWGTLLGVGALLHPPVTE